MNKVIKNTIDILFKCAGNLLVPSLNGLTINNDISFSDKPVIGRGSFGTVYLVDGHAVKTVSFKELGLELANLLKETTALSMLGRLRFIGINHDYYYIGMDYLSRDVEFNDIFDVMEQLSEELYLIQSFGIIHCDIKLANIRGDSKGNYYIIDFGECRFTPAVNSYTHIGTTPYRDVLLLEKASYSSEIDIWSLGIVFYILETGYGPWNYETINEQWDDAMLEVGPLIRGMLSLDKNNRWTI